MRTSAASASMNHFRVSGSDIPAALRTFSFKGATYRTLHVAAGFADPAFTVRNVTPGPAKSIQLVIGSEKCSGGDYFYPAEIISPGVDTVTTANQEVQIDTDPYCGMLGAGSYPDNVRRLIEESWRGSLLPVSKLEEGLFFKDRGASVVFADNLFEIMGNKTGINHVSLLIGERLDDNAPNRFAAQLKYSTVGMKDIMAAAGPDRMSAVFLEIAASNARGAAE